MILKRLLPFVVLAVIAMTGLAYAQLPGKNVQNGAELDAKGEPYSNQYWSGPPADNVMALVRAPGLTENQFILRLSSPHTVSGCMKLSNYGYMAEYKDAYLDISINDMTVDMRDQPQYAHYQCNQQSQIPSADVILNRQDLVKNETHKIRLHNGSDSNYYNISLTEDRVLILPDESYGGMVKRFKPQNIPGRKTALVYWFYPVGTLILWMPGVEASPSSVEALRAFAASKGLVPMETIIPDFESPLTDERYQYFVDAEGTFDDREDALADGMPIGTLSLEKKVYGLEKDEMILDEKAVYAKRPGTYE